MRLFLFLSCVYSVFSIQLDLLGNLKKQSEVHGPAHWHWEYDGEKGPSNWVDGYPKCGGRGANRQSPIDISSNAACKSYATPLTRSASPDGLLTLEAMDNGHAYQCNLPGSASNFSKGPSLVGGPLPDGKTYTMAQLHFHWGENDRTGSEHKVDGQQFPLEMHQVHYNRDFGRLKDAAGRVDPANPGLAVVSFLFDVCTDGDASGCGKLITDLAGVIGGENGIMHQGDKKNITAYSYDFSEAIWNNFYKGDYYTYRGSLTTPPCFQSVVWIVYKNRQKVTSEVLEKLRRLTKNNVPEGLSTPSYLQPNFRPIQALNGRTVNRISASC